LSHWSHSQVMQTWNYSVPATIVNMLRQLNIPIRSDVIPWTNQNQYRAWFPFLVVDVTADGLVSRKPAKNGAPTSAGPLFTGLWIEMEHSDIRPGLRAAPIAMPPPPRGARRCCQRRRGRHRCGGISARGTRETGNTLSECQRSCAWIISFCYYDFQKCQRPNSA
jgi:hypothetical protein